MKLTKLLYFGFVCFSSFFLDASLKDLGADLGPNKIRILVGDEAVGQKTLETLKAEKNSLEKKQAEDLAEIKAKRDEIAKQEESLKKEAATPELNKKKAALVKLDQVFIDMKETKQQIFDMLKQHIDFWAKHFAHSGKGVERVEKKSLYTFADLQKITKKIASESELHARLKSKKEEEDSIIQRHENQMSAKEREVRDIEKNIEDLKKQQNEDSHIKDKVDALDLEKEVALAEKDLADLYVELHQKEADFIDSRIIVIQDRLKLLREDIGVIRNGMHVDKTEIAQYESTKNETKREVTEKKAALVDQKNKVLKEKSAAQEKLEMYSNKYNISISDIRQVEDWKIKADTVKGAHDAYIVSNEQSKIALAERQLQKIKAEIALEDAKLEQAQVLYDTVKSWYNVTQGLYKDSDCFEKAKVSLKEQKATLRADIKKDKNEISIAHGFINDQMKVESNIEEQKEWLRTVAPKKPATPDKVTSQSQNYDKSNTLLKDAAKNLEQQKDLSLKLIELYTKLIDLKEGTLENVNFMLQEVEHIGVWHRATSAVTWEGIKNIIPNIKMFLDGFVSAILSNIKQFDVRKIAYALSSMTFAQIFLWIFFLFFSFLFFVFLQTFLPSVYRSLMIFDSDSRALYGLNRFLAALVSTVISVFSQMYWWFVLLIAFAWYEPSVIVMLFFFTYSIIMWIYTSRIFLNHFLSMNRRSDYMLLSKRLVSRFAFVFSFFSISTIVLLFFRKMFMLVMIDQHSEFPNILLRVYHVVIFVTIVFSIDKEELIQLLPQKNKLGQVISSLVEQYYYIFLVLILGLLVMGDPYLGGYGTLIWHMFWSSFFTIFALFIFFFMHKFVRQYTEALFFQEDEISGGSAERFENAKTWYGFYVVLLFFAFSLGALLVCANIWGYDLTLSTLKDVLYYELPYKFYDEGSKVTVSLKVIDLVRMFLIILSGFFIAYLFRRFVLDKIFEIHYVDPGVQNTINIISRYCIIFLSFMIAFAYAGFVHIALYTLGIGLLAFGWSFKDLFTDMVAYFFILVQRPLKLGDFVMLDKTTMGVVRKISLRAVVLRRKNAVNIVVPNSTVLKASLYNWNYTRTYIGLNDIVFAVPFEADIVKVKQILSKIVDQDPDVLKVPQPIVRLEDFCQSGYVFLIRCFVSSGNTLRQWDIASNIRFAIVMELAKENIQVASSTLEIVMKNNPSKPVENQQQNQQNQIEQK